MTKDAFDINELASKIDTIFNATDPPHEEAKAALFKVLEGLEKGLLHVAECGVPSVDGDRAWHVNVWIKKALLLMFRFFPTQNFGFGVFDKFPSLFEGWDEERFKKAGFRVAQGACVRRGAYIAPRCILMPCFINIGASIGEGTLVDTWSTVGSCAHIGKRVHIAGGAGIGGVLEPLQAKPVIIEDDCFIGARCEVAEGFFVSRGSVIGMGVYLGASTKVIDRATGEIFSSYIPPYSVVVPGSVATKENSALSLACAVIVKRVDAKTREKTTPNELLRT